MVDFLRSEPTMAEKITAFKSDAATLVRLRREMAGLTREQLAEQIGVDPSVVSRFENADCDDGCLFALLAKFDSALDLNLGFKP
jgi:ribosome-binding protein aMBF1 (putative translation factor)